MNSTKNTITEHLEKDLIKSFSRQKVTLHFKTPRSSKFPKQGSTTPCLVTLEKYPLVRLKVLQQLLRDTLETDFLDETRFEYFKRYANMLDNILGEDDAEFFCSADYLYRKIVYSQKKTNLQVGRLYPSPWNSYCSLSRELRGLLVNNSEYIDFDMVNAHPTLLLEYVISNMGDYVPQTLKSYVYNRDQLLTEKSVKDSTSLGTAKTCLLKALNTNRNHATSLGSFCLDLYEECSVIRDHMYTEMYQEDLPIFIYFQESTDFHKKDLEKQKVSIQSIYLQTKETDYVYELINFLRDATSRWIEDQKGECYLEGFQEQMYDKEVDINILDYYISCIPFFDGVYVGSECYSYRERIRNLVLEYNNFLKDGGSLVRFKEKKIEREQLYINPYQFESYCNVFSYLKTIKMRTFKTILTILGIEPISFSDMTKKTAMRMHARKFRRRIYKALIEVSEMHNIPFNPDFASRLTVLYSDRLSKHLNRRIPEVVDDEDDL